MIKIKICLLALALSAPVAVFAQDAAPVSLKDSLVNLQGYTQVSEGFFTKREGSQESYVSVGAQGQGAMLQKLNEARAETEARFAKDHSGSVRMSSNLDGIIEQLSAPQSKVQLFRQGDCLGLASNPIFGVNGISSSGTFASAFAQNYSGKIDTTNRAHAFTMDRGGFVTSEQLSVTHGSNTASAQVNIPSYGNACEALALASVQCPGASTPGLVVFLRSVTFVNCQN